MSRVYPTVEQRRRCPVAEIIRSIEVGIDTATPRTLRRTDPREIEIKRLPVGIDYEMQQKIITAEANSGSQSVRIMSPVWAIQIHAMPLDLLLPEEFGKRRIDPLSRQITVHPQRY